MKTIISLAITMAISSVAHAGDWSMKPGKIDRKDAYVVNITEAKGKKVVCKSKPKETFLSYFTGTKYGSWEFTPKSEDYTIYLHGVSDDWAKREFSCSFKYDKDRPREVEVNNNTFNFAAKPRVDSSHLYVAPAPTSTWEQDQTLRALQGIETQLRNQNLMELHCANYKYC